MSLNAKLTVLKQKEVVLTVKEVKIPENAADPLALFESNSAAKTATANEWIIDVFPNQVPIFTYIHKLASSASALANHKDNAKSSLATICLYYTCVFQAFFLLNDLHVRPEPSAHASSWSTVSWKSKFAEWLLSLPVPDSMQTIFAQLYATQTDKTMNVFFIPSAAGFNLHHHFGRFIPLNFYAHIHDCIATMPGNSKPADIWKDLLPRVTSSYYATAFTSKTSITIADILGVSATGNTAHYCASKWFQSFQSIFNPVLFRDFHRRSSLATLDLAAPKFTSAANINAYDILFGATPQSLRELKVVLQHVSGILSSTVPMKQTLSQMIASSSGINILQHGYSEYALPTWLANKDTVRTTLESITKIAPIQPEVRATNLKFLVPPTAPTTQTTVTAATAGGNAAAIVNAMTYPWSLVSMNTGADTTTDDEFVAFDDERHTFPKVLVLDVTAEKTVSAHLATLTGKIIEYFEIDGTTVSTPHFSRALAAQNCQFADSAIPFRYVFRAVKFRTDDPIPASVLLRASPKATTSQPASSLLYDRTVFRLPEIPAGTTAGTGLINDSTAHMRLPGTTHYGRTSWLKYAQSFLGFHTKIPSSTIDTDFPPATEPGRLLVWSPYTYTSQEDVDNTELVPDLSKNRTYFLTNLRTLFGTDTNLVEVVHPMEAMPV